MTDVDDLARHRGNARIIGAVACVGGALALILHDQIRDTEIPLHGVLPWLALLVGLVCLWRAIPPKARVMEAVALLMGAAVLYWHDINDLHAPLHGGRPWLVLLVGLVLLWRSLDRTNREAALTGAGLMIAGMGLIVVNPFFMLFGAHWLLVVGFALPFCVGIVASFPRRARTASREPVSGTRSDDTSHRQTFPQFGRRLALWTGFGCLISYMIDWSSAAAWAFVALPFAAVGYAWLGLASLVSGFRVARCSTAGKWVLIATMLCASLILQVAAWRIARNPPTVASLERDFHEHRAEFDKLLSMALDDAQFQGGPFDIFNVTADAGISRGWMLHPLSAERVVAYQRLLDDLRLERIRRWWTADPIKFIRWSRGSFEHGRSKGFVYTEHPPDTLIDDLDEYEHDAKGDGEAWRHLDGNWYLFFERS